jgi:hypothetical protein
MSKVARRVAALCLLLLAGAATAAPRLDLRVRLDPATRQFAASAVVEDARGLDGCALGTDFEITALSADGRRIAPTALRRQGRAWYRLPAGTRHARFDYRATLKPLARLDHRQVLADRSAVADPEGSFLPSASGWHPDCGGNFSYRLALELPAGQKGLVPGELLRESDDARGYRAAYEFAQPSEGIDLMAGPYAVAERVLALPSGRKIRLRTWFHAELAPLAAGYLEDSARYIERYGKLIGDYPFGIFSVVSSPTPTGFSMPGLTYLGREVLRLPFIRATSLGHEILHNWLGNGIYPDWTAGNWSEGLTTFLADYAYKEDQGEEAARAMRLAWLRNLAAVPAGEDGALKDFSARRHGISSIVGYDKAAMVFLMLRDEIGAPAFARGLRLLWERKRFDGASWADLEAAFATAAGRPLKEFFRQWVERPGAPVLRLTAATLTGDRLELGIEQSGDYALEIPLHLVFADRGETRKLRVTGRESRLVLDKAAGAQGVELDPDYRLWRRVDPALLPAILREVFVAPRAVLLTPGADEATRAAALALAGRVLDARPAAAADGAAGLSAAPTLVIGLDAAVDAWLARHGLPPCPVAAAGSARAWAGRDARGIPYAAVAARDLAALGALTRALPHYGSQSWLAFDGPHVTAKGVWPPRAATVPVSSEAARR